MRINLTQHERPSNHRLYYLDEQDNIWTVKTLIGPSTDPSAWRTWPFLDCADRDYSWYERKRDGFRVCRRCVRIISAQAEFSHDEYVDDPSEFGITRDGLKYDA